MRLLASCFTLPRDLGLAIGLCSMLSSHSSDRSQHKLASNPGSKDCLQLHSRYSKYPAFGHHARNASTVAASPGLDTLAVLRAQLTDGMTWHTTRVVIAHDSWGASNRSPRRSRSGLSNSQDDNTPANRGDVQYLSKRQSRYIEDVDYSSRLKAPWQFRSVNEHLFHRWKRFKRNTRSDFFAVIGRSTDRSKHQKPIHLDLHDLHELYDVGPDVRSDMVMFHEQCRAHIDRFSGAPGTFPGLDSYYNLSSSQQSSPRMAVRDVVSKDCHTTVCEATSSYFEMETQRAKPATPRFRRTSTSGTTVYTPPLIAEASPNSEKLKPLTDSDGSSNGSPGNRGGSLSFL